MRRRRMPIVALALAGLLTVSACGDDDDDTEVGGVDTTDTSAEVEEGGDGEDDAAGDVDGWCEDLIAVQAMEPAPPPDLSEEEQMEFNRTFFEEEFLPAVQDVRATAPDEVAEDAQAVMAFFEEHGDAVFQDPQLGAQFNEIEAPVNTRAAELCDAETVTVNAVDYAFDGVPAEVGAGRVMFEFENAGDELHEMVVLRKKDGTTESFEELLQLPEEEAQAKTENVTFSFAMPGGGDTSLTEIDAGEYVMLCFIPVGLTPDAAQSGAEPQGPPHFIEGMRHEFTVS